VWNALKTDEDGNNQNVIALLWKIHSKTLMDNAGQWNQISCLGQSHGDLEQHSPGTDLHHLRPADVTVNETGPS
jgi:endonuclease I